MKTGIYTLWENHVIGGCALNHGLEMVHACGKGPCAKVWDVRARWLCTVHDTFPWHDGGVKTVDKDGWLDCIIIWWKELNAFTLAEGGTLGEVGGLPSCEVMELEYEWLLNNNESLVIEEWLGPNHPWEPSHSQQVTCGNANHANSSPSDLQVNSWTALRVGGKILLIWHPAYPETLG